MRDNRINEHQHNINRPILLNLLSQSLEQFGACGMYEGTYRSTYV